MSNYIKKVMTTASGRTVQDISGCQYGLWSVLSFHSLSRAKKTLWLCRCACGTERTVPAGDLKSGRSHCCGCYTVTTRPPGDASLHQVYVTYQYGARQRGYVWGLTEAEFRAIAAKPCVYCGVSNSNTRYGSRSNGPAIYNGIDRVDNNLGYILDNCVPCCKMCNQAKRNYTVEEFITWAKRLAAHSA